MYIFFCSFFSKVFYGKIYAPKCVRWENNEEGSNIIMMRPLHAHTAVLFRFFLSKYIIMDFGKDSSTDKTFVRYHGLRTPNEGINQRNLKIQADVAECPRTDLNKWSLHIDQRLPQHKSLYFISLKSARIEILHGGFHMDFSKTAFY